MRPGDLTLIVVAGVCTATAIVLFGLAMRQPPAPASWPQPAAELRFDTRWSPLTLAPAEVRAIATETAPVKRFYERHPQGQPPRFNPVRREEGVSYHVRSVR